MKKLLSFIIGVGIVLISCGCSSVSTDAQDTELQAKLDQKISEGYIESLNNGLVLTEVSENYYKTESTEILSLLIYSAQTQRLLSITAGCMSTVRTIISSMMR